MYDGIRAYGGIRNPGSAIAIAYFIILVIVGNCILDIRRKTFPSFYRLDASLPLRWLITPVDFIPFHTIVASSV